MYLRRAKLQCGFFQHWVPFTNNLLIKISQRVNAVHTNVGLPKNRLKVGEENCVLTPIFGHHTT